MSNQYPYLSPYDPSTDGSQPANQPQVPQPQAGDAQPSLPPLSYQGWEYQGSPYGEAYAASSDTAAASQSVPSPADPSGEMFDFGTERIVWTLIKCAVALVFALAMIPLYAVTRRNYLAASARGDEKVAQQRQLGLGMVGVFGLGFAIYALSNGVPAVLDVADGPHTVTVTSCSFEQYKTSRSRYRGGVSTVYENQFIMTFEDGSTHTQTVETDSKDEIARQGDVTAVLYEACALRSGNATMTIGYYTHSRVVASARIND